MNSRDVRDEDLDLAPMPWRSIGAVASAWATRLEAQREESLRREEPRYVPVAWAAE